MAVLRSLHSSPTAPIVCLASLMLTACPSEEWIAVNGIHLPAVARGQVVYLEYPPTRPHEVIGIITPPAGEYETAAEAVKDMLKIAAKYGPTQSILSRNRNRVAGNSNRVAGNLGPVSVECPAARLAICIFARKRSFGNKTPR